MPLTEKQKRFAEEYAIDGNPTQAAIRAGYSDTSAYSTGHDLLKKPEIGRLIAEQEQNAALMAGVTAQRVLKELADIAFASLEDLKRTNEDCRTTLDMTGATGPQFAAIKSLKVRTKNLGTRTAPILVDEVEAVMHDKLQALQQLSRTLGLFEADNVQRRGQGDVLTRLMEEIQRARSRWVSSPCRFTPSPIATGRSHLRYSPSCRL